MPAFAGVLSGEQIAAVAAYVAEVLSDPAARTAQTSDGGVIFRLYCSGCHSAAGRGGAIVHGVNAPNLRLHPAATALAAVIIGPGNMPVFAGNTLDTRQQAAAARYVEALLTTPSPGGRDLGVHRSRRRGLRGGDRPCGAGPVHGVARVGQGEGP